MIVPPKTIGQASRTSRVIRPACAAVTILAGAVLLALHRGSPLSAAGSLAAIGAGCVLLALDLAPGRRRETKRDAVSSAMAAAERLAGLGSIAGAVAHEIRNPLSALDIHAQLLEESLEAAGAGEDALNRLSIIRSETHRLNTIIENFVRFSRHRPLDVRPVQMGAHLENVMRLIQSEARERTIAIDHAGLRTDLPAVMADPNQLEQAFLNVVINALQSMSGGGRLTLSSRASGRFVECVIGNTGPEIPAEHREQIFDLYFTTKEDGSGLGLPIARRILSEHDGYITFKSDPAQTSFFLGVPAAAGKASG